MGTRVLFNKINTTHDSKIPIISTSRHHNKMYDEYYTLENVGLLFRSLESIKGRVRPKSLNYVTSSVCAIVGGDCLQM